MERAQLLASLGRHEEAIPALQKAVALDPEDPRSRVGLVAAYISAGRFRESEIEWQKIRARGQSPTAANYETVIGLYASRKQFASVVVLCKERLQTTPDDAFLLPRLAAAYRELGDMDAARQTALKAAAVSPQLATQLQDFLNSLEKKGATK
jgi:Flp pilus assembly protein TadD